MELFSKKTLGIASTIFAVLYPIYIFVGGLGVSVASAEPTECQLMRELKRVQYTESRFINVYVLKHRTKQAGGDTLYVPLSLSNASSRTGSIYGTAYKCKI